MRTVVKVRNNYNDWRQLTISKIQNPMDYYFTILSNYDVFLMNIVLFDYVIQEPSKPFRIKINK